MLLEMWVEVKVHSYHARARVCRQLYVLRASHALVQATVGVGTVIKVYVGVAYTRGVGVYLLDCAPKQNSYLPFECELRICGPILDPHFVFSLFAMSDLVD